MIGVAEVPFNIFSVELLLIYMLSAISS